MNASLSRLASQQFARRDPLAFFHLYARWFVYRVGRLLSGNKGAFRYFADSIIHYYDDRQVRALLQAAGFHKVSARHLFLGIARIHIALKP